MPLSLDTSTPIAESVASPGASYATTTKLDPVVNHLYIAAVFTDNTVTALTLAGAGLTWVAVANVSPSNEAAAKIWVFRAMKSSSLGTEGSITATFTGGPPTNAIVVVYDLFNLDISGTDGSAAVVQSATGATSPGTSVTATLAAFGAGAAGMAVCIHKSLETATSEGRTLLAHTQGTAYTISSHVAITTGDVDNTIVTSWATSANCAIVGLELKQRVAAQTQAFRINRVTQTTTPQQIAPNKTAVSGSGASTSLAAATTRGGMISRVGERFGLAYDVDGFERSWLRDLFNRAIRETLLATHSYLAVADVALTAGTDEYRLPTSILAIDNGRGSTPAGIGTYDLITLAEYIDRASANIVSPTYRKCIAIEGNLLLVTPVPGSSESLRFWYVPEPTATSDDTHDFTNATYGGMPYWCDNAVEAYMSWRVAEYDQKVPTSAKDLGPADYKALFDAECALVRKRKRQLRSRTSPRPLVGYPTARRPFRPRNDVYPA